MENNKKGGFGRRTEGRREYGSNAGKRPRISRAGTRGAERVFSGENSERRSFGEGRSFGSDRPRRSFGEGSERPRRTFGENSERPRRNFSEGRPFGSDRPRRSFGEGSERPRRTFGENSERPRRNFGEGSERRSFGDRKPFGGDRRSGGFRNTAKKSMTRRDFNYFRDENESGINKMINRRPQLDGDFSDNDMVMVPVKEEVRLNKFIANSGVCSRRERSERAHV